VAADDLVSLMALNWFPERRGRYELPLLRRYHEALAGHGVVGYGWDELWTEYRWSVAKAVAVPIWQWEHGLAAGIWFNNLERILLAFEDLDCMELVARGRRKNG